jgi:hypothetical protein
LLSADCCLPSSLLPPAMGGTESGCRRWCRGPLLWATVLLSSLAALTFYQPAPSSSAGCCGSLSFNRNFF